jgi:Fe-S-cluster containining protein
MFNSSTPETQGETARPPIEVPDLCHKCGRCCRSATTFFPFNKLQELVEQGDEEATAFLEIFEPFPSVEEARKAVPEQVDRVLETVRARDDMNEDEVTFYHCRYVTEEGLCGIYERRPRCCKEAPYNGWSLMPPGCGFEGWQFVNREKQRADIRKLKEVQFQMEMLSPDGIHLPTRKMTLEELRESIQVSIDPWKRFGADHW